MHKSDPNAFAYIVYERARVWLKDQVLLEGEGWLEDENGDVGDAPFFRARMFFAEDTVFSREDMWEREVDWLDPENTRIVPLYTQ